MSSRLLPLLFLVSTFAVIPQAHAERHSAIRANRIGMAQLQTPSQAAAAGALSNQLRFRRKPELKKPVFPQVSAARSVDSSSLVVPGMPIVGSGAGFLGFDGLDTRDSALQTGFVNEPSDQALGVNSKHVFEGVNDALAVYSQRGTIVAGPTSFEAFFNVPPPTSTQELDVTDPRIFFDWATNRWFVSILEFPFNPQTGKFLPGSSVLLGVSDSSDATGSFTLYSIDVSDNSFSGCPCIGDQPLIGTNQDGFYISTNEFSSDTQRFRTALVIALDKRDLVNGSASVTGVSFDGLRQAEGPAFSVQPALPAPGALTSANNGTEFFASSLDFTGTIDNRLTVWSLTNTRTLHDAAPNVSLRKRTFTVQAYGQPAPAIQKHGPTPLGDSVGEPEELLDTGDDRLQQLFFSGGRLFTALTTVVLGTGGAPPRVGVAWFAFRPSTTATTVSASIVGQGYIAAKRQFVFYPSMAVSGSGRGVIGFGLSGPDFFPSTAYVDLDGTSAGSSIHIGGPGVAPEDGFSGYKAFGGNGVARWGDYTAAAISPGGHVWFASDYITPRERTKFTNWGTFIARTR